MEQVFTVRALALILLFVTLNTCQANSDSASEGHLPSASNPVEGEEDVYKKLGDKVVLSPGPVTDINTIVWIHRLNIVVEWFGRNVKYFKDRCTMNVTTGELTILGLTREDSGRYTAEINNRVLNPVEILVISEVPTPTVSESCDAEKTHCVLTCEGITTDAEPVVYSWWSGDVMKSKTKELNITKEEKEPSFFCKIENPVSFESSKEVLNPFTTFSTSGNSTVWWLLVLVFVSVCFNVGAIGVFISVYRTGKYPPRLLRVRSRFKTFPCWHTADSSQTSSNTEMQRLLSGKKKVVQGSSNLVTINKTDVQVTSTQDQKTDESTGNSNEPETLLETSVVDESSSDLETTTETLNSEDLNSNMEEKQENENYLTDQL